MVDCVYMAACSRDARLTRICVASVRYFYPDVPIRILAGDILQPGLAEELARHWNVSVVPLPEGDYGWGLVKLEPLFGPPGERFLVMDVDTVFTGRVLDLRATTDAPFLVDNEVLSDADFKRLYYDWEKMREVDPDVQDARTAFNVGQWFGTAGLVKREEFDRWVEWSLPRRLRYPDAFMGGDQGVMNYVILKKERFEGLRIHRTTLMRWPGNSLEGFDAESVAAGRAPPLVIHWAGMKAVFLRNMVGSDLLVFFEKFYYSRIPGGTLRRLADNAYHVWLQWKHYVSVRVRLTCRRFMPARPPTTAGSPS
ncbi:MAG TPA: hypothetical protein VEC19_14060 [Usitatibacter sp.]|nr:hypothetical protein [Usitatibacter sp.]